MSHIRIVFVDLKSPVVSFFKEFSKYDSMSAAVLVLTLLYLPCAYVNMNEHVMIMSDKVLFCIVVDIKRGESNTDVNTR